jgi:hypothetical protein
MRDKYSREEVAKLFEKVSEESPAYSAEEIREAGRLAGFSSEQLEASAGRLEHDQKKRRHLEIGAGLLVVLFATITFGPSLAGTKADILPVHNEHRTIGFDVEILVPTTPARDCTVSPDLRHDPNTYCILRKQNVRPHNRTRIGLPAAQDACPQVWIRTFSDRHLWGSNIFELPANVEIERNGSLDQKGLGAPNRYSAPNHDQVIPDCRGTT